MFGSNILLLSQLKCCSVMLPLQIPDVTLTEKKLHFSADGYGAKGQHNYGFLLDFHSSIDPEVEI
jgi:hypothetical protein